MQITLSQPNYLHIKDLDPEYVEDVARYFDIDSQGLKTLYGVIDTHPREIEFRLFNETPAYEYEAYIEWHASNQRYSGGINGHGAYKFFTFLSALAFEYYPTTIEILKNSLNRDRDFFSYEGKDELEKLILWCEVRDLDRIYVIQMREADTIRIVPTFTDIKCPNWNCLTKAIYFPTQAFNYLINWSGNESDWPIWATPSNLSDDHSVDYKKVNQAINHVLLKADTCGNPISIDEPRKENSTMNNNSLMSKLAFGPVPDDLVAMSPYGLAVQKNGEWYAYDVTSSQTVEVTGFTFSVPGMIYKQPCAISAIAKGDLIMHNDTPIYVTEVEDGRIQAIDLCVSEEKTVVPVKNLFNFNFVTKVAPLVNFGNMKPSTDQPFGNIMPMLMMSKFLNNKSKDNDPMTMFMMMNMTNGANPFSTMFAGVGGQTPS